MTKAELVKAISDKSGLTKKDSEKALSGVIEAISESLANGESVQLVGFGTFEVRERKARAGINPRTKKKIQIAATTVPAFKAGKALKEKVSK